MAESGCMFTRSSAERIATATRQVEASPIGSIPAGRPHKTHAGTSAAGYRGPFACVLKDDTTVTVQGYNTEAGCYFKNYVILGTSRNEVAEADVSSLTSDTYIYLDITYSSSYSIVISSAASIPDQSATHCYVPLAFVKCTDSKISSITQIQYGTIHYPGRVF